MTASGLDYRTAVGLGFVKSWRPCEWCDVLIEQPWPRCARGHVHVVCHQHRAALTTVTRLDFFFAACPDQLTDAERVLVALRGRG